MKTKLIMVVSTAIFCLCSASNVAAKEVSGDSSIYSTNRDLQNLAVERPGTQNQDSHIEPVLERDTPNIVISRYLQSDNNDDSTVDSDQNTSPAPEADTIAVAYTSSDLEYYLTDDQILFIRPGLELEILDVVIPADRQTEVTFKITDPEGLPLDREGVHTPGPVSTSFILSFIPKFEESYVAYTTRVQTSPITGDSAIQGTSDSGGSYTWIAPGTYLYKFGTVLPTDYDTDVTHTLGIYARRDLTEFDLDRYVSNELEHFVPSGFSAPQPRDIVTTETCNGRCHDPLAIHGGARREVGLCILCHNATQDIDPDTGNSVDFPLMIHKIHMGANLTNGYTIIGFRQSVHDYSDLLYPANVNECEVCHTGGVPTKNFPLVANPAAALVCDGSGLGQTTLNWEYTSDVEIYARTGSDPEGMLLTTGGPTGSYETDKWVSDGTYFDIYDIDTKELLQTVPVNATVLGCISNAPGTFRGEPGVQHTNWMDNPSRKTCGACHDYIDWETGEGHSQYNIVQPDDNTCGNCHVPYTGNEFDRSVKGAHLPLYKSAQLPGVVVKFVEVINTNPGDNPTVIFSLGGKNEMYPPSAMDRLYFVLSGPNDDYNFYIRERAEDLAVPIGENWAYTFTASIPEDAEGSFTISMEGRINAEIKAGQELSTERDYAENPRIAFAVTDATAVERRMVVDDYKCESCHVNLALHGGNRHDPQYCDTCHRPDLLDIAEPIPENVSFKWMIHKIHRGADLENGYVVIRSRGTFDFSHVEFSGDLRNCEKCHVNGSEQLPLPQGLLPTSTPLQWWDPTLPMAAACLSCHDGDEAAAHAYSNTAFFGESCSVCHGEDRSFSVDRLHAR